VSNFPVGSNISVAWSSTFTAVATVNPAVDNTWQYETQVTALALGKAAITAIGYVDGTAGCYASALLQVCSNAGTACVNSYDCCSAVCTRGTCQ
jgi:formylmethanofuran:tetrahydromethanopterin formyltransferase